MNLTFSLFPNFGLFLRDIVGLCLFLNVSLTGILGRLSLRL